MRLALIALLFAACTDDGPSSGGPGVTTHVESFQVTSTMRHCMEGVLADIDPNLPGAQYECSISETVGGVEMVLPACNNLSAPDQSTNKPCWTIMADPQNCFMAEHLTIIIERSGAPPDGLVNGQCLVQ
jgi:hypothetical protein